MIYFFRRFKNSRIEYIGCASHSAIIWGMGTVVYQVFPARDLVNVVHRVKPEIKRCQLGHHWAYIQRAYTPFQGHMSQEKRLDMSKSRSRTKGTQHAWSKANWWAVKLKGPGMAQVGFNSHPKYMPWSTNHAAGLKMVVTLVWKIVGMLFVAHSYWSLRWWKPAGTIQELDCRARWSVSRSCISFVVHMAHFKWQVFTNAYIQTRHIRSIAYFFTGAHLSSSLLRQNRRLIDWESTIMWACKRASGEDSDQQAQLQYGLIFILLALLYIELWIFECGTWY